MAHETSEPKNKTIFFWMFASAGTLVALVPLLQSYFFFSYGHELEEKVLTQGSGEYAELERSAREGLASAPTSITAAVEQLSGSERPAVVAPTESSDLGALEGWSRLPHAEAKAAAEAAIAEREAREAAEAAAAAAAALVDSDPLSAPAAVMDATNDPDNR